MGRHQKEERSALQILPEEPMRLVVREGVLAGVHILPQVFARAGRVVGLIALCRPPPEYPP